METCYIVYGEKTRWCLFSERAGGFCISDSKELAIVLREVVQIFVDIFGTAMLEKRSKLAVCHSTEYPITFRNHNLIFLTSQGSCYLQHIYQFSHELCHYVVPREVCGTFRWFEETLCQIMSWYALQKIFERKATHPIDPLLDFYDAIPGYIRDNMAAGSIPEGQDLPEYVRQNLAYLKSECYDRPMNRAIGKELYPLFLKYPVLWNIVPRLSDLLDSNGFTQGLQLLCSQAGIPESIGSQLIKLLGEQS